MNLLRLLLLMAVAAPSTLFAQDQAAVVQIISDTSPTTQEIGSGFFISNDGKILTCYHVIQGAKHITIQLRAGKSGDPNPRLALTDVTILSMSTKYDLAVLQINNLRHSTAYIALSNATIAQFGQKDVSVYGYPVVTGMNSVMVQRVQCTGRDYQSSITLTTPQWHRHLFAININVIPLAVIALYNGISGGPVVYDGEAIGVLSGSFNEGAGIAWAIPVSYLSQLDPINKSPSAITTWPPLRLMESGFSGLRKETTVSFALTSTMNRYERLTMEFLDTVSDCQSKRCQTVCDLSADTIAQGNKLVADGHAKDLSDYEAYDLEQSWRNRYNDEEPRIFACFDELDAHTNIAKQSRIDLYHEIISYIGSLPDTAKNKEIKRIVAQQMSEVSTESDQAIARASAEVHDGPTGEGVGGIDGYSSFSEFLGAVQSALKIDETNCHAMQTLITTLRDDAKQTEEIVESLFDADTRTNARH